MQIILVQSEIEQAITQYIADKMTIAEGVDISIDLKATRGSEGFQATVDLTTAPVAVPEPVMAAVPAPTAPMVRRPRVITRPAQPPAEPEAQETPVGQSQTAPVAEKQSAAPATIEPEDSPETGSDPVSAPEPQSEETKPVETESPPAAAAPRKSLFAGMNRPVNS